MELPEAVERHLRDEYDGVFDEKRLRRHIEDYVGLGLAGDQVKLLKDRVPPGGRILDLGAGYGSFVLAAREDGYNATGVDVAPVEVTFARDRLGTSRPQDDPNTVYRLTDGAGLPFADASFDAVTMWNVLEHVEDRRAILGEAARVLRPAGLLYVVAPNYGSLRREAHYGVFWAPHLRGSAAAAYLRLRRKNPRFFRDQVHPCTARQVRRELRELDFIWDDLTVAKLHHPETIQRPEVRRVVMASRRIGLTRAVTAFLAAWSASPLRGSITLVAHRRQVR